MQERNVVLTGFIGQGKTSLFNRICNTNLTVKAGGQSVTVQVSYKKSAYGKGFTLFDLPGYDGYSNEPAFILRKALTQNPINRIILVVKYQRFPFMLMQFRKQIGCHLKKYRSLITVAVTHWEQAYKQEEDQIEITNLLEKMNVNSVIFVSNSTSGEKICQKIDKVLDISTSQSITISDEEFFTSWNLFSNLEDDLEYEIRELQEECTRTFLKQAKLIGKFIQTFDPARNLEILYQLNDFIKKFANHHVEEFVRKNFSFFSRLEKEIGDSAFLAYYSFKLQILYHLSDLSKSLQYKLQSFPSHCYNFIRSCPHCREIWMREATCCSKIMICGQFYEKEKQEPIEQQVKYEFLFDQSQLICEERLQPKKQIKLSGQKFGCGRQFNWDEANLYERQIMELLDPELFDFLAMNESQIFQSQEQKILKFIGEEMKKIKFYEC